MSDIGFARHVPLLDEPGRPDMVRIPGGTFRMGSHRHYPEEAPAHRVTVSDFWMDRAPVANRDARKSVPAENQNSPQGSERRLASLRAELLPPLSPGCAPRGSSGYVHKPRRFSMRHKRGK
jgi:formylglycine-generating enzyme required for sulfatase activity